MNGHADEHGGPVFVDRGNYFLREGINIGKNLSLRHKRSQDGKQQPINVIGRHGGDKQIVLRQLKFFLQIKRLGQQITR